ncbi:uncharacterized protein LOC135607128 isoform X2 [Musa acuminata AAA Group]|uniref:uncharacterized protein LOC135605920 isoform X2 n=1 Tax=Musa acuminata AAA Group TaxID=214697 RepID=UPI0031D9F18E
MASSADAERGGEEGDGAAISVVEWQGWGTSSPVTATVMEVIKDIKALARDSDAPMTFGGLGGKLKCWLAMEDCMCSRLVKCSLWCSIKFWLYMHPKDFLRQNNTGKLLWQIFGIQSAALCLFGIREHEDIMWSAFRDSGKGMVWFVYPNQNSSPMSVEDLFSSGPFTGLESQKMDLGEKPLNFVLIDGTWSNSSAMHRRLKERWALTWGEEHLPCISLSTLGASVMHKLRPQPSWDRTCTAAAAAGILWELHLVPRLSIYGLDKQAEAVENALDVLLDALVQRRLRKGRSITRKERHNNCI